MVYIPLNFKGTVMKKFIVMLLTVVSLFSVSAMATDTEEGWKPVTDINTGKLTAITNTGDHGGQLTLSCDGKSHKLVMTYVGGGNHYDLFVFRDFHQTDMSSSDRDGKFIVGMNATTQGDVYYNVLKAKQAFVIARFPVGSGAKYLRAVATGDTSVPEIQQEGEEMFLAGSDMKEMLRKLSKDCPVDLNKTKIIF